MSWVVTETAILWEAYI